MPKLDYPPGYRGAASPVLRHLLESRNRMFHRGREWFGSGRAFRGHLVQPPNVRSVRRPQPLLFLQGIERLKNQKPTWERTGGWEGMKLAFGGAFSLGWFSPFSNLTCERPAAAEAVAAAPAAAIMTQEEIEQFLARDVAVQMVQE